MTATETSVESATKPNAESPVPLLSEKQALSLADQVLLGWAPSQEVQGSLSDQDVYSLRRLLADVVLRTTNEAAYQSSISTLNRIVGGIDTLGVEPNTLEFLHMKALIEEKRVETLLHLLGDIDSFFLDLCVALNETIKFSEDKRISHALTKLREAVIVSEEAVRVCIETNKPKEPEDTAP